MAKETHFGFEIEMIGDPSMDRQFIEALRDLIDTCPDKDGAVTQSDVDDIIDDVRKAIMSGDSAWPINQGEPR